MPCWLSLRSLYTARRYGSCIRSSIRGPYGSPFKRHMHIRVDLFDTFRSLQVGSLAVLVFMGLGLLTGSLAVDSAQTHGLLKSTSAVCDPTSTWGPPFLGRKARHPSRLYRTWRRLRVQEPRGPVRCSGRLRRPSCIASSTGPNSDLALQQAARHPSDRGVGLPRDRVLGTDCRGGTAHGEARGLITQSGIVIVLKS